MGSVNPYEQKVNARIVIEEDANGESPNEYPKITFESKEFYS